MTARTLLFTSGGALRAPWRLVAFIVATIACALIAGAALVPLRPTLASAVVPGFADALILLAAVAGAHVLTLRYVDRRPWADVWMDRPAARARLLGEGFVLGGLAIVLPSLLLVMAGWLAILDAAAGSWIAAAVRVTALLLVAALAEELLFRGYLLAVLRQAIGWGPALAITSVLFGYAHVSNPGASQRALLVVMLAGVFLGAIVAVMRSIYAAWMAHFGWNWAMAVLLHLPVSGLTTETPDYRTIDSGPDWATGGRWGPEGGAAGALGLIGGLGYLVTRRRREVAT